MGLEVRAILEGASNALGKGRYVALPLIIFEDLGLVLGDHGLDHVSCTWRVSTPTGRQVRPLGSCRQSTRSLTRSISTLMAARSDGETMRSFLRCCRTRSRASSTLISLRVMSPHERVEGWGTLCQKNQLIGDRLSAATCNGSDSFKESLMLR